MHNYSVDIHTLSIVETPLRGQPKEVKKCLQYWSWLLMKMTFVRRDQMGPR